MTATRGPSGAGVRTRRTATADRLQLLGIGAAAVAAGVSERALRYYQQRGLLSPACTSGGFRRYSPADLRRVARIRELQTVLALNLDEIATVLCDEDRLADICTDYHDPTTTAAARRAFRRESLAIHERLHTIVQAKRDALTAFLSDLDTRIAGIRAVLDHSTTR